MNVQNNQNFQAWFNGSKVVGSEGKPLAVYHGSSENFDAFDVNFQNGGALGNGFYFAEDLSVAESAGRHVLKLFLSVMKPLILSSFGNTQLRKLNRRDAQSSSFR